MLGVSQDVCGVSCVWEPRRCVVVGGVGFCLNSVRGLSRVRRTPQMLFLQWAWMIGGALLGSFC